MRIIPTLFSVQFHSSPSRAAALALLAFALLTPSVAAVAEEPDTGATQAAPDLDSEAEVPWLEDLRATTHRRVEGLAQSVDDWFGDEPFAESGGRVSGYIRLGARWNQAEGTRETLRFRVHARLPNLENHAYAFVGREDIREEVRDQPRQFRQNERLRRSSSPEDQAFFAGLGYAMRRNLDFRLGVHGMLRPYAQVRYRHDWQLSLRDHLYFRESLFWSLRNHFGSTTLVEYEHRYTPNLLLRWSNLGTISERSDGLEWQSSLGLFRQFSGLRMLSLEWLVEGKTSKVDIADYGVRAIWRQPVYKDWTFVDITLGHFWPREDRHTPRRSAWAIGATIELQY